MTGIHEAHRLAAPDRNPCLLSKEHYHEYGKGNREQKQNPLLPPPGLQLCDARSQ